MTKTDTTNPIVIVGGGLAGLATALTLAKRGHGVTLLDQGGGEADRIRTTTLNPLAMQHLGELGIIAWMEKQSRPLVPVTAITVSDEKQYQGRPNADDRLMGWDDDTPLAYVARNGDMVDAALALARRNRLITLQQGVAISGFNPVDKDHGHAAACLTDTNGNRWPASLIIACDGGGSPLREMAGIRTIERNPGQTAIVADVQLERPHGQVAWQRFLKGGPVALMPLSDSTMASLVWTLKDEDAKVLLDADPASFGQSLTEIALAPFGMMVLASDRRGWSLRLRHAIRPYAQRLVLLGDAAHAIHPLAGQGFNLAVGDMIGLADALEWGDDHGCEPGDASVLARYARGRVTETAAMTMATDGLNALFSFSPAPLRSLAGAAMTILDQSPLKNIALNFANGTLTRGLLSRRG